MKKIGFVDYYISEWHADNYPSYIAEYNKKNNTDFAVSYVYAEKDVSPVDGRTTDEWCREYGTEKCDTIEELCDKSDFVIILAPSDSDKHLPYARKVLPYGKPTYIDKSFAPSLREAEEIIAIAEKYNTPFFSASALRYSEELKGAPRAQTLLLTGSITTLDEYAVHLAEMSVMLLADPVVSVRLECQGRQRIAFLTTESGKKAALIFASKLPYSVIVEGTDGSKWNCNITADFFEGLIADMLRFFETKTVSFDIGQLREIMKIQDMMLEEERKQM